MFICRPKSGVSREHFSSVLEGETEYKGYYTRLDIAVNTEVFHIFYVYRTISRTFMYIFIF